MALQECELRPPGWQRFADAVMPPWLTTQAPWERGRRLIGLTDREDDGNLVDLLLDGDETRSRDLVAREEEAIIYVTVPHGDGESMLSSDDEVVEIPHEHLVTLDQELRWLPAATKSQARQQDIDEFTIRQRNKQTTSVDETVSWDFAALRRSRIRVSRLGQKTGVVPRPAKVADIAIDRADLRTALALLSRGERRSLERRFAGYPLSSGQRTQLQRALKKTREIRHPAPTCGRLAPPVHIDTEPDVCAVGENKFMEVSSEHR